MRNDVTRANAVSERKKSLRKFQFFSFAVRKYVKRKRASDDETKNIAGQLLKWNSKNIHRLKKQELEGTMRDLGKPFLKKIIWKTANQCQNAAFETKQLARKRIFVQAPFSHSNSKVRPKKHAPLAFRSTSCFGVTKITTTIWLQKSWKCANRS